MELECCGGDDSESVKDLMEMINKRSDGKIDAPWMKLQLFLTEKTDGTWLTQRNVQEDVSVTGDLDPLDDMPAPLNSEFNLVGEVVQFRITKENIKAKRSMCWWWFLPRTTSTPQPRFFSLRFYPTFSRMPQRLSLTKTEISDNLVKPLNHAFDHFQISFIRNDTDAFRLKLFGPSIRSTPLIDIADSNGNEVFSAE